MPNTEAGRLKECPHCGADVEGLIHYCDCCGEELYPQQSRFSYMVYEAGPFFDIMIYLSIIFDKLAEIPVEPYAEYIQRVEFDFWCYPIKKKTGAVYYASRKQVIATVQVDGNDYLYSSKAEKLNYLADEVQSKMDMLQTRLHKRNIDIEDLFVCIRNAVQTVKRETILQ